MLARRNQPPTSDLAIKTTCLLGVLVVGTGSGLALSGQASAVGWLTAGSAAIVAVGRTAALVARSGSGQDGFRSPHETGSHSTEDEPC